MNQQVITDKHIQEAKEFIELFDRKFPGESTRPYERRLKELAEFIEFLDRELQ